MSLTFFKLPHTQPDTDQHHFITSSVFVGVIVDDWDILWRKGGKLSFINIRKTTIEWNREKKLTIWKFEVVKINCFHTKIWHLVAKCNSDILFHEFLFKILKLANANVRCSGFLSWLWFCHFVCTSSICNIFMELSYRQCQMPSMVYLSSRRWQWHWMMFLLICLFCFYFLFFFTVLSTLVSINSAIQHPSLLSVVGCPKCNATCHLGCSK